MKKFFLNEKVYFHTSNNSIKYLERFIINPSIHLQINFSLCPLKSPQFRETSSNITDSQFENSQTPFIEITKSLYKIASSKIPLKKSLTCREATRG